MEELNKLLASAFETTPERVAELYTTTAEGKFQLTTGAAKALENIAEEYKQKIQEDLIPVVKKQVFPDARNAAMKSVLGDVEKKMRKEFELPDGLTFDEMLPTLKETLESKGGKPADDDTVKASPLYRTLQKQLAEKDQSYQSKMEELTKAHQKQMQWLGKKDTITQSLEALPINLEGPIKARQYQAFLRDYEGYDFEDEGGKTFVLKGQDYVKDSKGNPITLEQLVRQDAEAFFPMKAEGGPTGGAGGQTRGAGGSGGGSQKYIFKDETDYRAQYNKEVDPKVRKELTDAWKAQNKTE